ncbi:Glutamate-1-semialdehyde 2,1-aminomutase [Candidatus Ornithobacterium hominis]|uniref:Glutamate-1-semialdehyde 2,1-aminomutase n=1 Tax=Candidatus Ornithobacterium hominis TaxID=2497989 RepID=A0A383TU06_9FLAO|nr:glutamate-1-semialdehyde 2,1-aminomutase [Candidatus Ornithobacterium hominis]MCT7903704.1 glutamate-1-semialdehyde 2,1-aminomutase [Candidatus Ornithobacterium hominis]SZD71045.1 Glutamate-1-semialdehyde 2,1-aminomutase [Candidatus Ornithobacterium hominis]
MRYQRSSALFKEAQNVLPGGVNSPARAFKAVGGTPPFIDKAKGAYIYDADGNKFVDYINSWGPMILGHAHPKVTEALINQVEKGTSFGTPTELETEIAHQVIKMVPNIDKVRFVNSGTEACMSAIRLARGFTGREKIIKFAGCYHGHSDAFLIDAGSGLATFGKPSSPGVTQGTAKDTLMANYNDLESVQRLFQENPEQIAAVIIEPVAGNMGCIPPKENFLKALKNLCSENQSLLIFDEVMTGFRLAMGGAQELFQVDADIVTFGKIIGGGLPVGAFAARREIMDYLAPVGPVYQAGTLSGNPLAMCAGLVTLDLLYKHPECFNDLDSTTLAIAEGINDIFSQKGIEHQINMVGSMISIFFTDVKVVDFESAKTANNPTFIKFYHHMLDEGIYLPPSSFETWFVGLAISDKEVDKTLNAIEKFEI